VGGNLTSADAVTVGILHAVEILCLIFLAGWTPYFIWCLVDTHRFQRTMKRAAAERAAKYAAENAAAEKIRQDEIQSRREIGDKMNEELNRRIGELKDWGKCTVCNSFHHLQVELFDPCEGHKYPTGAFSNWFPQRKEEFVSAALTSEKISQRIAEQVRTGKCTVCNDWHLDLSPNCDGSLNK
jgi:hypothetical protein